MTLYQGMTQWFLNPQTNLIEFNSFLIWFTAAIAVVKIPSGLWFKRNGQVGGVSVD